MVEIYAGAKFREFEHHLRQGQYVILSLFTKINPAKLQFDKSFAKICPAKFFWFCHSRKFVSAKSFFTLKFFQENLYLQKCGPMIRLFTGILNNSYPKRSSNWTEKYTEKAQQTAVSEDVQEEVRK